ncbi:MAG: HD-GYP domain-containing protein [Actinomycetota bacterium]|nr:HD-GYP domain-containing protein [Actinomycetota bacterium]
MLTDHRAVTNDTVLNRAAVDALSAHVALCDKHGVILGVNAAWRQFADDNGGGLPDYGIGLNYLRVLEAAVEWARVNGATKTEIAVTHGVRVGFSDVLSGRLPRFQIEYRCDAPGTPRWFLLTISRVTDHPFASVLVAHENTTAIKDAEAAQHEHQRVMAGEFSSVIEAIARLIEQRDPYTAGHQRGSVGWCNFIADEIGFDDDRRQGLLLGAGIHDIGKIAVPAEILTRPGRLSTLEMEMIRGHAAAGYDVLRDIAFPWRIADMVHQHHENFDGSGYPLGLAGEEICIEARIIAVADMFDAMTSHRPYRAAHTVGDAIDELRRMSGTRYDPEVVTAMLRVIEREMSDAMSVTKGSQG